MLQGYLTDLNVAIRGLRKRRGFALTVIGTLALGIGINTAVFSVVDAVVFRPLPFERPQELVNLWEVSGKFSIASLEKKDVDTWRRHQAFARVETFAQTQYAMSGDLEPESVAAASVSPGMFAMLGVPPSLGRAFTPEDMTANGGRVVILSDAYWRTRFGSAPDAIGRTIFLNDQPFRVVGVMPARFSFPYGRPTFWTPLDPAASESGNTRVNAVGRLRSGLSIAAAQTVLDGVKAPGPSLIEGGGLKLVPLDQHRVNPRPRKALIALLGAVGFVLLLACVNAANLLLVRASDRQGEIAIRLAMGAARGRIVRELLTEALVLAIAGGGLGVILAWIGIDGLAKLVPNALTFLTIARIEMDPRVLLFTIGITVLTSIVFGLVPSLLASRFDLASALGLSAVRTTSDRGARRCAADSSSSRWGSRWFSSSARV